LHFSNSPCVVPIASAYDWLFAPNSNAQLWTSSPA
jgi:hypothetical protein